MCGPCAVGRAGQEGFHKPASVVCSPRNKLRFGRFRRVPQTQQVAGLGTNSLEYKGTYPNHPWESKWNKGQRSQDPDAVPLGVPRGVVADVFYSHTHYGEQS